MAHAPHTFSPFQVAVAALACCLATTAPAKEQNVTRWVDDQGQTHFTDRPPAAAEGAATTMTVDPDRNVVPAPPTPHFVPAEPIRRKPSKGSHRATRAAEKKAQRCTRDNEQLRRLHSRMLAGYTARQYNSLMRRKRNLERKAATDCH